MRSLRQAVPRFVVIGAIGFAVDAGALMLLARVAGIDIYVSRLGSFAVATLVTWWLNRTWTFASSDRRRGSEYLRYVAIQAIGGLINLAVFATLIGVYPTLVEMPVLPLAVASLVAMVFNFAGAHLLVFTRSAHD